MTHSSKFHSLAAMVLACSVLVGCGGGSGEAPPPPIASGSGGGSSADNAPLSLNIANNVPAQVASGPVVFTFVFSQAVQGFDATDVTVTGGTPSAFTMVSPTQYTLTVTPTANQAGTITVTVPAGSFTDAAGKANAAPITVTKNYIAGQTITFPSPGNQTLGTAPPALSATSTSGLPVTIASTTQSVCTVSGTTLTLVAGGTCSLTATQAGNSTFAAATPVTNSFTVSGGTVSALTFSSGFASANRTTEAGEFGGFSGSNLDNFACNGQPASCGGGGSFTGDANSSTYYYYQTSSPASALYAGLYILAPGVTGGLSATANTSGVQISGQTALKFNFGMNQEWFSSATNNFMIVMDLGKLYVAGGNACHLQLRRVVTPTAAAQTDYTIDLSSFTVVQDCGTGLNTAQALAASPISQVSFQAAGGSIALSDGTRTSGANLSVPVNGVYPTTLALKGAVNFQ